MPSHDSIPDLLPVLPLRLWRVLRCAMGLNYNLRHVMVKIADGVLTAAATDGHRLVEIRVEGLAAGDGRWFVEVAEVDRLARMRLMNDGAWFARAVAAAAGEFPNYEALIDDHKPAATETIGLGAGVVALIPEVHKALGLRPYRAWTWSMSGPLGMVLASMSSPGWLEKYQIRVRCCLMPMWLD